MDEVRPAGRGCYAIYRNTAGPPSKHNTYLTYHLSHPADRGEVQDMLGIYKSSSFVLQVKNPTTSTPPQAGLDTNMKADYPKEIIKEDFGGAGDGKGLRFVPANPVKLLDFKGAELLLIGNKTEIDEVLGTEAADDLITAADQDSIRLSAEQVMEELMMDSEKFPAEPLEGDWA